MDMVDATRGLRLSKSRFMAGLQCHKLLWWRLHEPDAPELAPEPTQQNIFDRGHEVGELARTYVPGGVLIDLPYQAVEERVAATAAALAAGAPVIYEASFFADGVFVAVDILELSARGNALIEVKSTLGVRQKHIPDVAIQVHVVRRAGIDVERGELMHLNRDCRYPDLSNLFARDNVTPLLAPILETAPAQIDTMLAMIAGPLPDVATGPHCNRPYPCPFLERCWPALPEHPVSTLHGIRATKVDELVSAGIHTLLHLPDDIAASDIALRQVLSVRRGEMIVEPGLQEALAELTPPIAFLDFETIMPAVPVWPGCAPYQVIPVQFSCHTFTPDGLTHTAWLADGPDDPREAFARALIAACAGARTVLAYSAQFERQRIDGLIASLPHLAAELSDVSDRLRDLLTIVREHVYHPGFAGSFSIKSVLPALVPGLGYDELAIQEGGTASALLETLLLSGDALSTEQRQGLREDLLRYCEFDTLAMVRLWERLIAIATNHEPSR
jgi:uncharacterized membrane protein